MKITSVTATAAVLTAGALLLAGCAGGDTASGPGGSGQPLEVWVMGDKGTAMTEISKAFTDESGVGVNVQSIPWSNAREKMSTAIASGDGPDVVQVGHSFLADFADAGAFLDLADYEKGRDGFAADNFFPASASTMEVGGETLSIPWISDTRVLFYRTDVLDEQGIDSPPATWDELSDDAAKLAARGDGQYGMGFNTDDQFTPLILTWSAGGDVVDDGKVSFTDPAAQKAFEFENSFYADGSTPKKALPDDQMLQGFKSGSIPMFISGPYMTSLLKKQAPELEGKWAVAPIPADKTSTSLMAGSNLAIFHKSAQPEVAADFIDYLVQPETQQAWFKAVNDLPARADALEALTTDPNIAVYYDQMQSAKPATDLTDWGSVSQEMIRAVQQINLNDTSVDQALDTLNSSIGAK